jgi:hypothetical protein
MFTAPDELRARLGSLSATQLVNEAAKLRPHAGGDVVMRATKTTALILARRVHALDAELATIDAQLGPLVKAAAPALLNVFGVGVDTAAVLLVTAGDNPERITSEGAWAMMCGIAPVPATSGKTTNRFRLNNGGDRHAKGSRIHLQRAGLETAHRGPAAEQVAFLPTGGLMGKCGARHRQRHPLGWRAFMGWREN